MAIVLNKLRKRAKVKGSFESKETRTKMRGRKSLKQVVPTRLAGKVLNEDNHDSKKQIDLQKVCLRIVMLAQALSGKKYYPYQVELVNRIVEAFLERRGDIITALISRQSGKCLAKGTLVIHNNGNVVPVEKIAVGDVLMGDDGSPRNVLSLARGKETMYEIRPLCNYAESYTVNESHILTLFDAKKGEVVDIPLLDFLKLPDWKKEQLRGVKAVIAGEYTTPQIDPYWFGLWLGDENTYDTRITTADYEVVDYIKSYARKLELFCVRYEESENNAASSYAITGEDGVNKLRNSLKLFRLLGKEKRIPLHFLTNSREVRLKLLAGIIDSDGHVSRAKGKKHVCEINSSKKGLANDILYLVRSLGFRASMIRRATECSGVLFSSFRICIYGELWEIPTKIARKKFLKGCLRENPRAYRFQVVKKDVDDYYGFCIDGNKRFLLGDFTITHNTESLSSVVAALGLILPLLARKFPDSWHLNLTSDQGIYQGFKDGVKLGIYAPRRHQAETMFNRCKLCFETDTGRKVLSELGLEVTENNGTTLRLTNGTRILCESASEQSKIEGETHQIAILEEAQDISDKKVKKSLSPMLAATKGTMIMIGTATTRPCAFYYTIKYNERLHHNGGPKNHFFYPHTICEMYNSLYREYVAKEKMHLGADSDEFLMSYKCIWIFERGMFLTDKQLFDPQVALVAGPFSSIFRFGLHSQQQYSIVAGLDFGKAHDSTVLTLLAVDWINPIKTVENDNVVTIYRKHVVSWFEWSGDDYETQFWEIVSILKKVGGLKKIIMDSNTAGEPIKDRMTKYFEGSEIEVEGFNFSARKKSDAYKSLYGDFCGKRITFPAGEVARDTPYYRKFTAQILDLRKEYANGLMKVSHPDEKGAKDDYADSLCVAAWGANTPAIAGQMEFDVVNPFFN